MSRTIYLRIISVFMNDIKAVLDHQNHNLFSILLFSLFSLSKLQFLSLSVCVWLIFLQDITDQSICNINW